ncbi:MAG: hypothetical protein KA146_09490 [Leptospiraceae bacterium]|nr:hypothetical protein [Leptospiraceae bacterium]
MKTILLIEHGKKLPAFVSTMSFILKSLMLIIVFLINCIVNQKDKMYYELLCSYFS